MRTTFFSIAAFVAIILSTPSCVEKSSKYKVLLNERDSIASEYQNLESDYNVTLDIINEVEAGTVRYFETVSLKPFLQHQSKCCIIFYYQDVFLHMRTKIVIFIRNKQQK
jgi:hypothetical protein